MVERRVCTFCGGEIEPGTGRMYIKKDGVVYNFCSSKCFKNLVELRRVPRRTTWTRYYEREKSVRMKGLPEVEEKPKARKVKKKEEPEKAADESGAAAEPQKEPDAEEEKAEEKTAKKSPAKKAPKKKSEGSKPSPEKASDGDEKE
jgi:large subunit ribosomal protein L24e